MKRTFRRLCLFATVLASAVFIMNKIDAKGNTMTVRDEFKYYMALEDSCRTNLLERLDNMGYINAGVTVSSVTQASGSKTYTVLIHHDRIDSLSDSQRSELKHRIEEMELWGEGCQVIYDFI